jgi:hypothetical protein
MPSFEKEVRKILAEYDCAFHRQGKGDHEIWFSPISKRYFTVDASFNRRRVGSYRPGPKKS